MLKKEMKKSISEEGGGSQVLNENGKRPGEGLNQEGQKKFKGKSLYRQPTVRELSRLQEAETLFNSNLFRLQLEEILKEVEVKEKTRKKFHIWFENFKTYLNTIPVDDTEYDLSEKTFYKHIKVKNPLGSTFDKTKCMFKFHKFSQLAIVGSYALDSSINSKLIVDVQITVPADTYTKNDSINYRYHKKRAAYLAYIASHLKKHELIEELNYSFLNGCESKPIIELKPNGKIGNHLSVRILLSCEAEAYKLHRFIPARNNLRESWLLSTEQNDSKADFGTPTPFYNSSVLCDLTAATNQEFLRQVFENNTNLKHAVVLLKIWLRQRRLPVSGHIVSSLVAHLVQSKRVNNIMSSYQIVRNTWVALKASEWDKKGITLQKGDGISPPLEEFHEHFPVVFLDCTGYHNLCWRMCSGTYEALRRESAVAVELLDDTRINSFIPLFMTPVEPLVLFDHILKFKNTPAALAAVYETCPLPAKLNYGADTLSLVTETVHALLRRGLGARARLIQPIVEDDFRWPVKMAVEKAKEASYACKLSFGFILDPNESTSVVDRGPPANLPEAEAFRAFWGDKSELRRFQDGAVTEAVVWRGGSRAARRGLTARVARYLLGLKYGITDTYITGDQLDSILAPPAGADPAGSDPADDPEADDPDDPGTGEERALPVLAAFDKLRRDLRALGDLPLEVSAVYGISPVFSCTEPAPPARAAPAAPRPRRHRAALLPPSPAPPPPPPPPPPGVAVSEVVVELGHSGKWPSDLQAFRALKAAFHLQLADGLHAHCALPAHAHPAHVDVLKAGYVFRLIIAHQKEIALLSREVDNGVTRHRDTEEGLDLQYRTALLPKIRGALHGLHQRHPAFGPAACLLKRWLSSHLLGPRVPPLTPELLTAAEFLRPAPLAPPAAPLVAFLRTLRRLAETDWSKEMLVLDFNDEMTPEDTLALEQLFSARDTATAPSLHVVTAYDAAAPAAWARRAPAPAVLARARSLAAAAARHVERAVLECRGNLMGAFVPSLDGYDVLIRLRRPKRSGGGPKRSETGAKRTEDAPEVLPVVDFDPVRRYLEELEAAYGELAVFFHDSYGGDVIAVLWRPHVREDKEFQITTSEALKPEQSGGRTRYRVNLPAVVEDFRVLGEGLVRDVTVTS